MRWAEKRKIIMIRPFDQAIDSTDELQELVLASQIYQHFDLEHQDITKKELRSLWTGAVEAHLMDRKIVYLIEVDDQGVIGGFVRLQRNVKRNAVIIDDIYVKQEMRDKGLGRQLVAAALERAKQIKAKRVESSVHRANTIGRDLYQRSGFSTVDPEYIDMEIKL